MIHISQSYITPEKVGIESIDETDLGNSVTVEGNVSLEHSTGNADFLKIRDATGSIRAVDFEQRSIPEKASVSGYVDVYEGELQIVVEGFTGK